MKLAGQAADRFCEKPEPSIAGALLHGPDEGLLALRRTELTGRITGKEEMRVTRLDPAQALKDASMIDEALRSRSFFAGRLVVLIERATDGLAAVLKRTLPALDGEETFLLVVAPALTGRSSLRKLFETEPNLAALGIYPQPPAAEDLGIWLSKAGLPVRPSDDALQALTLLANEMDAGSVRQLVELVALYGFNRTDPLGADEIVSLLPQAAETGLDALVAAVADGRAHDIGPLAGRLSASGTGSTRMLIATSAYFRNLLSIAVAGDNAQRKLAELRPPIFGPRRDRMLRQARAWGAPRLELALRTLFTTDRTLRSAGSRPERAIIERALIRLAMSAR